MKDYIGCIDDVSQLQDILEQKKQLINDLKKDCTDLERILPAKESNQLPLQSISGLVDSTLRIMNRENDRLGPMMRDLRSSLDVVSHRLRMPGMTSSSEDLTSLVLPIPHD